jgi:hypothetical protein
MDARFATPFPKPRVLEIWKFEFHPRKAYLVQLKHSGIVLWSGFKNRKGYLHNSFAINGFLDYRGVPGLLARHMTQTTEE